MSQPFLGEVKLISWNFPPKGWAFCNGALLPINQNQALFSLLGTQYGGDGRVTFGLPDMRGRAPLHTGSGFIIGQIGGEENHTLTLQEMPTHNHTVPSTSTAGNITKPLAPAVPAQNAPNQLYAGTNPVTGVTMNPAMVQTVGGNQAHPNMQPFLVLNYVIALQGIFPSRN